MAGFGVATEEHDILTSIQQLRGAELGLSPGDISVPSVELWTGACQFIDAFDAQVQYGASFVTAYTLDCDASSPMPAREVFGNNAFEGSNCHYLFLKKGSKYYPALPRRSFGVLHDAWGRLLKKHYAELGRLLGKRDIQHRLTIELARFARMRFNENHVFAPAAGLDPNHTPHRLAFTAIHGKDKLFLFHVTPPPVTTKALERYLKDLVPKLKECKKLLSRTPTTLGLLMDQRRVEFRSDKDSRVLKLIFIVAIPWCGTANVAFKLPPALPAKVTGLDQVCGLLDEIESADELSDFFDYLDSLDSIEIPGMTSYLDKFGSFRDSHSVMVPGAIQPNMIMLDFGWGSSIRYRSLKAFWPIFPNEAFLRHPRSWSIPEKMKSDSGLILQDKTFRAYFYCQRIVQSYVFINAPVHLVRFEQGKYADSLMHSLFDALELYAPLLSSLEFAKNQHKVQVLIFPASLVREGPELKHLAHLLPIDEIWKMDIGQPGRGEYGIRVVYNDEKVRARLHDATDRSLQIDLLKDVVTKICRIWPGADDSKIQASLDEEKAKPARFTMTAVRKRASFPELVEPIVPGVKEFKLANKTIAYIANELHIEPGEYEAAAAKEKLDLLLPCVVANIDEAVSRFDLKESLPLLIETVDALINEHERHERLSELSLTHEVEYERDERLTDDNRKFVHNYRYARFLLEKFVQLQPTGTDELRPESIRELLALVDRLFEIYSVRDFLHYSLYPARMVIDRDILVKTVLGVDVGQLQHEYGKEEAQIKLGLIGKKEDIASAQPVDEYLKQLDAAFKTDFGFGLLDFVNVQQVLAYWPEHRDGLSEATSYSATAEDIAKVCSEAIKGFDKSTTERILDFLTLKPEELIQIKTQNGFQIASTVPVWEHAKRLSRLTIRPLILIGDVFHWGAHSVERSARSWSGVGQSHRLLADFIAPTITAILDKSYDTSTQKLAEKIEEIVQGFTPIVKMDVYPHKYDPSITDIGDFDVLAWIEDKNVLLNIESKIIDSAYCLKDLGRIQRRIFGRKRSDGSFENGYIQKVEDREAYLRNKSLELMSKLGWKVPKDPPKVVSLFVTRTNYWWTKFPPTETNVKFIQIQLLDDFITKLSEKRLRAGLEE